MHIHILGICGTFMGSLAQLAKQSGMQVTGCDANVYPPMSTQLEQAGIELIQGFSEDQLNLKPDLWVIGNALSRGNPLVEAILNRGDRYLSGPEFLAEQVLPGRHVMAISGTHGKTTTSSMLAWILEDSDLKPGFLIGGVPADFGESARLGEGSYFVVEADEYDTAFFDKRSKFVHYRPRTLVINNLEFDHADIFEDLAAIQRQFHHLIRTVPQQGSIYFPQGSKAVKEVLDMGCWSDTYSLAFGEKKAGDKGDSQAAWSAVPTKPDFSKFEVYQDGTLVASVSWGLIGEHNMQNALCAIAAATDADVEPEQSAQSLQKFQGVKRRLEVFAKSERITLYDDFAHHPTAIKTTLDGLRAKVGVEKIVAVIEPRSNTMKQGVHRDELAKAVVSADQTIWFEPEDLPWSLADVLSSDDLIFDDFELMLGEISNQVQDSSACHLLVMSNGGFFGIHKKLAKTLNLAVR
jgi:UDP-N-acetylmuramate: L-alanyl-gamma-D-glutamyl-meso-diaminopimelate ligase